MLSLRQRLAFALLTVVVILAVLLYIDGRFDTVLYRFGLNHHPCTRVTGQIVCGPNIAGTPYSNSPS